ncbi:MAG: serine O-acetyltransferase [Clostridia bacterium]|nr:serine O-acetyltransferase [Clostridia bacterium]
MNTKERIVAAAEKLQLNYREQGIYENEIGRRPPQRSEIIKLLDEIRELFFPGYFGNENTAYVSLNSFAGTKLAVICERLTRQISIALHYASKDDDFATREQQASEITARFIDAIPCIQNLVFKDVEAELEGDPAAASKEEIILSYPGVYAIFVYRVAHVLYREKVPLIPRIMTEHAHSRTGIDINPGATIGESFFIDHGTGIVIGETTIIGDHVKLYQGVTLGALSTRKGQALSGIKRHPTIEDNVVIYSNTSILGGETVVGRNSVVAGNTFVTESIPENTKVTAYMPKLQLKQK